MNIPNRFLPFIWFFIKKQRYSFLFIFITAMVWPVNELFFPFFLKLIINHLHKTTDLLEVFYYLKWPLISLVSCLLVMEVAMRSQGILNIYTLPKFRATIRSFVMEYVKLHSHEYFAQNFAGSIAKKLSELPLSSQNAIEIIIFTFSTTAWGLIISLIFAWRTNPIFFSVIMVWFVIHMTLNIIFLKYGNIHWQKHSESSSTLSGKIVDIITNIMSVKTFARTHYESNYLKNYEIDEIKKAQKAMWFTEIIKMIQGSTGVFLILSTIYFLIVFWQQGKITLGDFTLIGMQMFWILGMVWYMSFQMSIFAREVGTINECLSLISSQHQITDIENAEPLIVKQGHIKFDSVTFGYQKNRKLFQNLNVDIQPGQKVGLVGFSGSGKTTFVNLLLRFYEPDAGKIFIDYQNIGKVKQDSLRDQIAMIPQEPMLFHRSLLENIRYGRLDASYEEIIEISKLAHCDEFIQKLPEGYQTMVGDRGVKLSGGQRQRIAIARAMLKNAPIIVLDEATSALDSITEKMIHEGLTLLSKNRTTIVIAHRLSTLADMDRILVFHQGKIIEDGSQSELLNQNGHFAMLWNMQSEGFLPN